MQACRYYQAVFGPMYRDCDLGTAADDCRCDACNGTELDAATPLYRLAQEQAGIRDLCGSQT